MSVNARSVAQILRDFSKNTLALATSCGFASLACIPELQVEEGELLIYEHSQSRTPCGGTARSLDDFVGFLADELDIRISSDFRYSWLDQADREVLGPDCPSSDCVLGRHALGYEPALKHEVVHLVMKDVASKSLPFLAEGIAGAYDPLIDGRGGPYPYPPISDPRVTFAAPRPVDVDYSAAASFVAFLLTRHGPAKFHKLYFRLRNQREMSAIRRRFREVYGIDFDREVDAFVAGVPCEPGHFVVRAYECEGPVQAWDAGIWTQQRTLDCADEDVVGGVGDFQWRSHRAVSVDIPTAGSYQIRFIAEPEMELRLGPCFGCVWDRQDAFMTPGEDRVVTLDAGRHFVRVTGDSEQTSSYEVVLVPGG